MEAPCVTIVCPGAWVMAFVCVPMHSRAHVTRWPKHRAKCEEHHVGSKLGLDDLGKKLFGRAARGPVGSRVAGNGFDGFRRGTLAQFNRAPPSGQSDGAR